MERFRDKVVLVTGSTQGLGLAYARDFFKEGAKVVIVGRSEERTQAVAAELDPTGEAVMGVGCDVANAADVEKMMARVKNVWGPVDILINNAAYHVSIPVAEMDPAEWDKQVAVTLNSAFYCARYVLPEMIARGGGKILNISSSAAKHFFPGFGAYAAAKGGMVSFTHTLSEEVKRHNINVNAIYLGMTNTEHTRERLGSDQAVTIPLEEMLQVEEVSKVVLFLVSEEASPIMGAALDVFGKKA